MPTYSFDMLSVTIAARIQEIRLSFCLSPRHLSSTTTLRYFPPSFCCIPPAIRSLSFRALVFLLTSRIAWRGGPAARLTVLGASYTFTPVCAFFGNVLYVSASRSTQESATYIPLSFCRVRIHKQPQNRHCRLGHWWCVAIPSSR